MDKIKIEKLKTGFNNYRFDYITSFNEDSGDVRYTYLSLSPGRLYYVVESEGVKTKYYKRFTDAINYFEKRAKNDETWIDLSDYMPQKFGALETNISIEDLDWLELEDLKRIEY